MNSTLRLKLGAATVGVALMACGATGQSVSLGTSTPAVGDGVQNLNFSADAASNTQEQYVPDNYLSANNGLFIGETFTTGANGAGYSLSSISIRQVSWAGTSWDYTGGSVTLRVFSVDSNLTGGGTHDVTDLTPAGGVTVAVPDVALDAVIGGTPTSPMWLTFALGSSLNLDPNAMYGFAVQSTGLEDGSNDGIFFEMDGTSTDSYAGGYALSVDSTQIIWDGGIYPQPSDRAFVATMTAVVPEPSSLALFGLGGLGALMLRVRRRTKA